MSSVANKEVTGLEIRLVGRWNYIQETALNIPGKSENGASSRLEALQQRHVEDTTGIRPPTLAVSGQCK